MTYRASTLNLPDLTEPIVSSMYAIRPNWISEQIQCKDNHFLHRYKQFCRPLTALHHKSTSPNSHKKKVGDFFCSSFTATDTLKLFAPKNCWMIWF